MKTLPTMMTEDNNNSSNDNDDDDVNNDDSSINHNDDFSFAAMTGSGWVASRSATTSPS